MIRNILFWLRKTLLGSDGHRGEGPDVTDRFSPEFASGSFVSFNIGLNMSTTSVPVRENATDIRRNVFKKPFFEFFTVFSGWTGIPFFYNEHDTDNRKIGGISDISISEKFCL